MPSFGFRRILEGLRLIPKASLTLDEKGDLQVLTSDGRLYYHDGSTPSTLVTANSTDTLTNKTLTDPIINGGTITPTSFTVTDNSFTIENNSDHTKQVGFDLSAATTGTKTTLVANQTADRTIAFPNADGTLAGISATQTLTNKTISGNTATNFINGAATITLPVVTSTLATLAGTETLTNKTISGASNTITNVSLTTGVTGILPKANGGSGQDNSSITFPASGVLVTETGTETLTNKTLTTPVINIEVLTEQGSTPSNPSAGSLKVYAKTDNVLYILNSSGSEQALLTTATTTPAGVMVPFAGTSAPTGWLNCDGSAISRTTFAGLFTAISTTWGIGDGSTTFNLPNMQRSAAIGSGGSGSGIIGNAVGNVGGAETYTLDSANLPPHKHLLVANAAPNSVPTDTTQLAGNQSFGQFQNCNTLAGLTLSGSGQNLNSIPITIMQPSAVVLYIIKT